jgi:hypothetical protein
VTSWQNDIWLDHNVTKHYLCWRKSVKNRWSALCAWLDIILLGLNVTKMHVFFSCRASKNATINMRAHSARDKILSFLASTWRKVCGALCAWKKIVLQPINVTKKRIRVLCRIPKVQQLQQNLQAKIGEPTWPRHVVLYQGWTVLPHFALVSGNSDVLVLTSNRILHEWAWR